MSNNLVPSSMSVTVTDRQVYTIDNLITLIDLLIQ